MFRLTPGRRGRGTATSWLVGFVGVLALGLGLGLVVFRRAAPSVVEFTGRTMGTTYSVKVANARMSPTEKNAVAALIDERLTEINQLMSTYDSTSELERFNRKGAGQPFIASPHLVRVLDMAMRVSEATGGAFDVTARPLVDAWGFGPEEPPMAPPTDAMLRKLMTRVGYRYLEVDTTLRTITKTRPDVTVDLSGIAKGYGADWVAAGLAMRGLCCFLVEIGGDLRAVGARADGTPWRVGIENPNLARPSVVAVVELDNESVATSGDYRNFLEWGGKRYAHIVDPRTGCAIPFTGASVSVINANAAVADAWATALTVLGVTDGMVVATRAGIAARFTVRTGDGTETRATPAFAARRSVEDES